MNYLSHLECGMCGTKVEADRLWNLCPQCQKPLLARYDLRAARKALDRDRLMEREPNMWRYGELMPVRDPKNILCLGEGFTPLHHAQRLGRELKFTGLYIKDEGCAPMVKAFQEGKEFAPPWLGAKTIADGMRVPAAVGDFLIIRAVRESQGTALAVSDAEILEAAGRIGRTQGIFPAPEGAATLSAFLKLRANDWIKEHETVVLFNTGSGHKYSHLWDEVSG
jgi:threonine synthase